MKVPLQYSQWSQFDRVVALQLWRTVNVAHDRNLRRLGNGRKHLQQGNESLVWRQGSGMDFCRSHSCYQRRWRFDKTGVCRWTRQGTRQNFSCSIYRIYQHGSQREWQEFVINTTGKDIKAGKEGLPPLRNPPLLETADDLATLSHLNEPSGIYFLSWPLESVLSAIQVLHTIRNRYAQHSIYTYSGIVLIAVNPFQRVTLYGPEIIQAYSGRKRGDLEPHLFAIAEDAYTAMAKEGMGQTIIVSGER